MMSRGLLLCVISLRIGVSRHSHSHSHSILEEILAPVPGKADFQIVSENDILMEEIVRSAKDSSELFDADVPGKLGETKRRRKRQINQDDIRDALCKDKNPGEFFRLVAGPAHCRDVVACADHGLQAIRCPPGLSFDLGKQTCEWKNEVTDCNQKSRPRLALPLLHTTEPLCVGRDEIACGDGTCLPRELFCDEKFDCEDGSDETLCDSRNDPNRASDCDPELCQLPDCFCSPSGQEIPGGLYREQVPQMIVISFDDAINNNNFDQLDRFLSGKLKNPNGCDIKSTFFVSHQYNNYSMTQEMYRRGHEIAVHSISHHVDIGYWHNGTEDTWGDEMGDMRRMISRWANIPLEEIYGSRAPFLKLGGNNQFSALAREGFLYDSTMVAPLTNPPYWPYPLAFASPHRCHGNSQKCPTRSHAVMELIMNEIDPREEPGDINEQISGCSMVDSCAQIRTGDSLYNVLTHNFIRHYEQNRAPLGLYLHAAWFAKLPEMQDAFLYWLEELLRSYDDVYVVTMSQVLAWMQSPTPASQVVDFGPWREKCTSLDTEDTCQVSNDCALTTTKLSYAQRLQTCNPCPAVYPWLGDVSGTGGLSQDEAQAVPQDVSVESQQLPLQTQPPTRPNKKPVSTRPNQNQRFRFG